MITIVSIFLAVAVCSVTAFFLNGNDEAKADTYVYDTGYNMENVYLFNFNDIDISLIATSSTYTTLVTFVGNYETSTGVQTGATIVIEEAKGNTSSTTQNWFVRVTDTTNNFTMQDLTIRENLSTGAKLVQGLKNYGASYVYVTSINTSQTYINDFYKLFTSIYNTFGFDDYVESGMDFENYWELWDVVPSGAPAGVTYQWYFQTNLNDYRIQNNLPAITINNYETFNLAIIATLNNNDQLVNTLLDDLNNIRAEKAEIEEEFDELQASYDDLQEEYEEYQNKYAIYEGMDGIQGLFHSMGTLLNVQIFGIIPLYAFIVIPLILAVLVLAFKLMR